MAAGIIDHEVGTRDIRRLSGLYRLMPGTAMLATIAAAAMAGVPLLNGFLSKEMFFAETIEQHVTSLLDDALPYLVTLAAMFSVTYSLRFIYAVFFGRSEEHTSELQSLMRISYAVFCLKKKNINLAIDDKTSKTNSLKTS